MTVYVDGRHMIADTLYELEAMALKIGLPRNWRAGDHFQIGDREAAKACEPENGAVRITPRQAQYMSQLRHRNPRVPMITPERAQELISARIKPVDALEWPLFAADAGEPLE